MIIVFVCREKRETVSVREPSLQAQGEGQGPPGGFAECRGICNAFVQTGWVSWGGLASGKTDEVRRPS